MMIRIALIICAGTILAVDSSPIAKGKFNSIFYLLNNVN